MDMNLYKYRYRMLSFDLSTATTDMEMQIAGAYLVYYDGSPDIQVRLNDMAEDVITIHPKGEIIAPFSKFFLTWGANPGQIINIFISSDSNIKLTGQEVVVSSVQEIQKIDSVEKVSVLTPVRVNMTDASAIISASNSGRKSAILKNMDAANTVYLGYDNAVTAADGYPLEPKETVTLSHYTGDIYGVCGAGLTANVAVLSEG